MFSRKRSIPAVTSSVTGEVVVVSQQLVGHVWMLSGGMCALSSGCFQHSVVFSKKVLLSQSSH